MSPALMLAHRGGQPSPMPTPLTVTKAPRALHIDPRILAQPELSLTACALLAEVLDLYQVKGQVFADDDHFAARCKCSPRTVRSTIAELEEGGYLERDVNHKRSNKRLLVPTDKWQILPEVVADFAGSTPEVPAEFATTSGENCQEFRQNLPGVPAKIANINTRLNTKGNTKSKPDDAAHAAGAEPEKKLVGVEVVEVLPLPTASPTPGFAHQGGAADVPTSKRPVLMRASPVADFAAFVQAWEAAAAAHPDTYADFAGADLRHYHGALLDWSNANRKTKYDWLATIRNSMRRDADGNKLRRAAPRLPHLPGVAANSPVLQRLATAEAALALNEYDDEGNRIN